jgi:predicted MPP superfamily phosphohydrolase
MLERLIFPHFFEILTVSGALAAWGLLCWLAAPAVSQVSPALHVLMPLLLALLIWGPARRAERRPATSRRAEVAGNIILATAFVTLACAAALAGAAGLWALIRLPGALRAEATVVPQVSDEVLYGPGFRVFAEAILALTAGTLVYGYVRGQRRLEITRVTVELPGLPPDAPGIRVVHVSDLHLGPRADRTALRAAIDRVLAIEPDLVCVTGDIVDSPATDLDAWMPELTRLTARHGVFAILGNHDRFTGADRVSAALRRWTTWRVLRDEVAAVRVGSAALYLLGLEDRAEAVAPRLAALRAQVPEGAAVVLLAHHPDVFEHAPAAGVRLTLAGHTHGGQIAPPGLPHWNVARLLIRRFDSGTYTRAGSHLHVNRGLGTSGQPVRVGVPAEITTLSLVAPEA